MNKPTLKDSVAFADLNRDLTLAEAKRQKQFATIVRHIKRREAAGPAKDMMEQIRRDEKLCKLLVDYEDSSELIGRMEFLIDLNIKAPQRG